MASHITKGWEKDPASNTRYMLTDRILKKAYSLRERYLPEKLFSSYFKYLEGVLILGEIRAI
jgi:hypothetical protein